MTIGPVGAEIVIGGIGSEFRHDDGAGIAVAHRVASAIHGAIDIGPLGEPLDLLGRWDNAELAVIIDTVHSGALPGTVTLIELGGDREPTGAIGSSTSTHGIGLIGALRIARALNCAPRRVVVVAIEGGEFGVGMGLSPSVERAIDIAAQRVIELAGANA